MYAVYAALPPARYSVGIKPASCSRTHVLSCDKGKGISLFLFFFFFFLFFVGLICVFFAANDSTDVIVCWSSTTFDKFVKLAREPSMQCP